MRGDVDVLYRPPLRRWQARLALALDQAGYSARLVEGDRRADLPAAIRMVLAIESRLLAAGPSQFDIVAVPAGLRTDARGPADATIALDGESLGGGVYIEPLFDGGRGDAAFLAMVTRAGAPLVRINREGAGASQHLVAAVLAIEERRSVSRALDQLARRVVTLLVRAVQIAQVGETATAGLSGDETRGRRIGLLRYCVQGLAGRIAGRIWTGRVDHWHIGYRRRDDEVAGLPRDVSARIPRARSAAAGTPSPGNPRGAFTLVPHDDRARFLADPMPFTHDGRSYVFFEDFPYATRRGVIGMVEIGDEGRVSPPETVLQETFHLSYPFVFENEGTIYMLPETSEAGRVQLYRADPFPTRWVADRVLIENIVASDATLVRHEGRWWLFATLADDGGSTWDALGLFHAKDPLGPFVAHPCNPVLVDAGAARPAGAMWHEHGTLMRIAQDCRTGYGRGLAVCRVDRLDEEGFAQTILRRVEPTPESGADGVHTWNAAGGLEVIDLHYPSRRPKRAGRRLAALHATARD